MSNSPYVPLHNHTDFSMLQSACTMPALIKRLEKGGFKAAALTDFGNMCGSIAFTNGLKKIGIQPILGCFIYLNNSRTQNPSNMSSFNGLILLAKNNIGYQNLCKINAHSHLEGFHIKPRIDRAFLRQHCEGIIAIIPFHNSDIASDYDNNADPSNSLNFYIDVFGKEHLFLELQKHKRAGDEEKYPKVISLAKENNIGLVASQTVFYPEEKMAIPHDIVCCVGEKTVHDPQKLRYPEKNYYLHLPEEMEELFSDIPEALENTRKIAALCDVEFDIREHYPIYPMTNNRTQEQHLLEICVEGLEKRYNLDHKNPKDKREKEIVERTDFELGVIHKAGYDSYFLVVWDFINWSKTNGIPVGPGRGSGAGSIVAYLTGITNIDPIEYNLLFERFLNPERISPPDFDIDFCERRRPEVIDYVRNKYGREKVAQIGTYGTMKAKAVIKDVTRALGYEHTRADQITKLIPEDLKITLHKALFDPKIKSEELIALKDGEEWVKQIIDNAMPLEGLNRNMGIHACGVIIGDQDLTNLIPLMAGANGEVVTQFSAGPCEDLGLLKMDFLGLRTLTLIKDTLGLIRKNHGVEIDIETIPIDDRKTYKLFQEGKTTAVFQYESAGMQKYMKELQPTVFPDLIAMNALYRPGPIAYIPSFIERKHGREEITYDCEGMDEYLKETYGITVYQEQVMLLSQKLGSFTKGEADTLRKAMGKKKMDLLAQLKPKFLDQGEANGHNRKKLEETWEKWEAFASYAFNKSHSTCYAWVAYQTAYLKSHYPAEFMAAVMTSELGNADKITFFLEECRNLGIKVLPPHVNKSQVSFSVENGAIRFALGAIKGVGTAASETIVKLRDQGEYESFMNLCERVGHTNVSRKVLEGIIAAGGMDEFGNKRSALTQFIDRALEHSSSKANDLAMGQMSLFADIEEVNTISPDDNMPEWDLRYKLDLEKTLLGFYATGHPVGEHKQLIKKFSSASIAKLKSQSEDRVAARLGVMISNLNLRKTKKGKTFASFNAEDLSDGIECICWDYDKNSEALQENATILIDAEFAREPRTQLIVRNAMPIHQSVSAYTEQTLIIIQEENLLPENEEKFKALCTENINIVNDYEQRLLAQTALNMVHKNQSDLLPKFEKYLTDCFSQNSNRLQLEQLITTADFACFNQNTLLQPDQKRKLLHFLKDIRSTHKLYIRVLTKDDKEIWLEPSNAKNFLPTWDFINDVNDILGMGSIKIKASPYQGEIRKQYRPASSK
ncbi:DNA polymerase III subunit alpha [Lentisphaera profundi]|uniref:DNA polymerase III subunit alpha n=1 Tax=Lentisphaera profundi TaxID=1658616 RepID=A0ABY7VU21_9BACT|nr:DNA polymerase III subunit alpha [Lentisphaera profundi]WDE95623.1 DNA polymerase III subunit alpha [Lentisphaera profundi]